jgi:hypothetical protein
MATCPRCGAQATGNFCSNCGGTLAAQACPNCASTPEPGARFCNHCGFALVVAGAATSARAAPAAGMAGTGRAAARGATVSASDAASSDKRMIWGLAGAFVVGVALIVLLPILKKETTEAVPGGALPEPIVGGTGSAAGTPPDISNMSPRQRADALFTRVMSAAENGDTATAMQFMPMALAAFDMAQPLDLDGLWHLALLHETNKDLPSALAVLRQGLDANPDHLLLLGAAAEVSLRSGDAAAARQYNAHFLQVYDGEIAKNLEEYRGHSNVVTQYRQDATNAKP